MAIDIPWIGYRQEMMYQNMDLKNAGFNLELIKKINPSQVMIYTIARDTPLDSLEKISLDELNSIANRVESAGFDVQVSG